MLLHTAISFEVWYFYVTKMVCQYGFLYFGSLYLCDFFTFINLCFHIVLKLAPECPICICPCNGIGELMLAFLYS